MLPFACMVVRPGSIFLRRLIDLSRTVPALAHRISLPAAARADIAWWVEFLPSWNGRAFFPRQHVAAAALGFATDASGVGLGAAFGLIWLTRRGPPPSALIMSLSWSYCRGGRRPLLGRGMSCHTDSPAHGQHAGGAGFDAGHVYVPPPVAYAPGFLFPCPAERAFASGARAGLPGYCRWYAFSVAGGGVPVQSMRDTARADDGSVSRLGVALTRRLLANCVATSTSRVCGSGLNQCLTFCREVGIPHPFPSKSSCWICLWPSGVRAFPWPPSARTWQGCSISASVSASRRRWRVAFSRVVLRGLQCSQADRFPRPPGQPISTTLILPRAYIRRHFPARDAIMLLSAVFSAFFGLLRSAGYCSPSLRRFARASTCSTAISLSTPNAGWEFAHHSVIDRSLPGGGGGVRAPLPHRLRSVPSPRYTSCLAHTPPSPARVRLPGRVILDPGPFGAHPPRGVPFHLRPAHPLLPPRGRVRCGCHGLLLGMIPALGRLRIDSFKRYVQLPSRCVPSPAPRVEVFGVTRGHSGPPPSPRLRPGVRRGGGARRLSLPVG